MDRCMNHNPTLFGIPYRLAILLLTIETVSFFAVGSVQIPIVCLIIYAMVRITYLYEPLFFLNLGAYLQASDLNGSKQKIMGGKPFSSILLWRKVISSDGNKVILENKDGSFQTTLLVKGIDFQSESMSEVLMKLGAINESMKTLSKHGITIFWDCRRTRCNPGSDFFTIKSTDCLSYALKLIAREKKHLFENAGLYKTEYFLTLIYKPEAADQRISRFARLFVKSGQKTQAPSKGQDAEKFKGILDKFINKASAALEFTALNLEQTAGYLHSCTSTNSFNPAVSGLDRASNWAKVLPDQSLYKGLAPILGDSSIKAIGIKSYPNALNTEIRSTIVTIPSGFRWITRVDFLPQSAAQKLVGDKKIVWANSAIKLGAVFGSLFTGGFEDHTQKLESNMAEECQDIMDDLKESKYAIGIVSSTIIIINKDETTAIEESEKIKKILENYGVDACLEDLNAMQAFLSSIPGTIHKNARQFKFTSKNIVERLLPLSSPWEGSLDRDCLFTAKGRD